MREKNKEEKIGSVDSVAKGITDANIVRNVYVKRCVGEVGCEGICRGDHNGAEKTLVFKRERKNIGKLGAGFGCVWKFFWNEPDYAVDHSKGKCGESNNRQNEKFMLGSRDFVADDGNDQRDCKGDGTVDTAGGIKIVDAHMIGQEVCVPGGKTGGKQLVDRACRDHENDKTNEQRVRIFHDHRQ